MIGALAALLLAVGAAGVALPAAAQDQPAEPDAPTSTALEGARGADVDGVPLGWGALSGLAAHPELPGRLFSVTDSAYAPSRILEIDATKKPARITGAITVISGRWVPPRNGSLTT